MHIEKFSGKSYLTILKDKHRGVDVLPEEKLYVVLPFPSHDRLVQCKLDNCDSEYDIDPLLAQKLLRSLIATMISLGQAVNLPGSSESLKWDVRLCPLDWDMELRLKLSNWFLTNGYKSFEDISKDYKFRTGIPLAVKVLKELFVNADDEVDLQLVFELTDIFKIPLKVKSMEMEVG